jgi:poly-gamma-glutamate capsule biosynthesis protein CapA/YwtB (metallophosphatase superfamily)
LSVTLFLAGDVMTGRGIDQILARPSAPALHEPFIRDARDYVTLAEQASGAVPRAVPGEYPWGDALRALAEVAPDARIVNLETSITADGAPDRDKSIHYRMHPANVACLSALGVDVAVLANNHVLDWGRPALLETLDALARAHIAAAGAGRTRAEARRAAIVPLAGGRRAIVVGLGDESSGIHPSWRAERERPGVDLLRDLSDGTADEIGERVRATRRPGDVVIASVHWGSNWGYDVPETHVRFARALIDRGVDVVHGHSSHHPRPIELHRGKLVLYGCGDFLNDYEGIGGHGPYRAELVLAYLPELDDEGRLVQLRMLPLRIRKLRLERATPEDARWLAETMERISQGRGLPCVTVDEAGALVAKPD